MKNPTYHSYPVPHWSRALTLLLCSATMMLPLSLSAQRSVQDGDWNTPATWDTAVPIANGQVFINGGFEVDYTTGISPILDRIYVGDDTATSTTSGTLNVTGGTLTTDANTTGAVRIGNTATGTGTLNVSGGTLQTTGTGWLNVGAAANSTGNVTLSGGIFNAAGSVVMASGDGANGSILVNGGQLIANGDIFVGRRIAGTLNATFEQTSGSTDVVNDANYLGVGYSGGATGATQIMNSTASITGGSFTGNVRVGRQDSLLSGGGTGTLTIGSAATVTGRGQAWELSGTGEIIFSLGVDDSFTGVDLTAANGSAFDITQSGAIITVDGSNLAFSMGYSPISLMTYVDGSGPSLASIGNVTFNYTGFDPGFAPTLSFTDTSLQLNLNAVPEPSSVALFMAGGVLALAVARRRRQARV